MSIVGLISDTHGLLRAEAIAALQGCDLIIHAGDVGDGGIIESLQALAPATVVRGNIDQGSWAASWPATATVEAGRVRICVLHDIHQLRVDPAKSGVDVVVSGHSHKPTRSEHEGVLYINPGSAGPRRFGLPITVARLDLRAKPWNVEFVDLSRPRE